MPYWLLLCLLIPPGCWSALAQPSSANSAGAKAPAPGTYQIRNQKYQDLLRPRDANHADGTRMVLYSAEPWKCMTWRLRPEGEGDFRVQNLFTSKTFAAQANEAAGRVAVVQAPLAKTGTAVWRFTRLDDGSYRITDPKSGNALTAVKGGTDSEAKVALEPWRNGAEQKWELQPIDPKQLTM